MRYRPSRQHIKQLIAARLAESGGEDQIEERRNWEMRREEFSGRESAARFAAVGVRRVFVGSVN